MTSGITVVVPVYDEARTLEGVVRGTLDVLETLALPHQVLILDDGSTDGSTAAAERLVASAPERVQAIAFAQNRGKGALLDEAFRRISTELAVVVDADGEYAATDLPAVLAPLFRGSADWVLGSRYGFGRERPAQYRATWAVNRAVNAWFAALSGLELNDLLTGLYAFRTELVADLRLIERRFAYTPELMWRVLRSGRARIVEVPVSYRFRDYAAGKKIRWWETGTILAATLRYKYRGGAA
jgi:glycosyltransferase involved in cell wall biosynthesis